MDVWKNQLFFEDNLDILRSGRIPVGSADLIYLDPPFNSNTTYNNLFAGHLPKPSRRPPAAAKARQMQKSKGN